MTEKPTTGKVSYKAYQCSICGAKREQQTNHWGDIYNIHCTVCRMPTVWQCEEEVPEGYGVPEPWKLVPMKDVLCQIK